MTMKLKADRVDPPLAPGSPEWCRAATASKTAAILRLSPWTSRFACYYTMAGLLPRDSQTANQSRGHWLEPAVANWLADELGLHFRDGGCWRNREYPWMVATPDRLAFKHRRARQPLAVVEIKTSGDYDDWGPDGSDSIPSYYRAQVVFQMGTLGLPVGYVGALLPRLNFRAYTIHFDEDEFEFIRQEVSDFIDSLPGGVNECPPDIDSDDSTYEAARKLHKDVEDRDVTISPELAMRFIDGIRTAKVSESVGQAVKAEMQMAMGEARRAVLPREGLEPIVIATRQSKGGGTPYVAAPRKLPDLAVLL